MADITVQVEGSGVPGGYQVVWTATSSTDMPTEVFLHKWSSMEFEHVIRVSDLTYPTTRTKGQGYYRQDSATVVFDTIEEAEKAKVVVDERLQLLVTEYNNGLTDFLGTTTSTYT